jgi:hypothetical protein
VADLERDWTALALAEAPGVSFTEAGHTKARVAVRAELKTKTARPRALNRGNEAEWAAQMGVGTAAPAIREEARALRGRVEEDAAAMARAQELLRDRHRAQSEALRISQRVGVEDRVDEASDSEDRDAETKKS